MAKTTKPAAVTPGGDAPLAARLVPLPGKTPAARVKVLIADFVAAAKEAGVGERLAALFAAHSGLSSFLAAVFDLSPFLRRTALRHAARLVGLLEAPPEARLEALFAETAGAWRDTNEAALGAALRDARAEAALLIGLADLGGALDIDAVTRALTRFADAAVGAAVRFLLAEAAASGRMIEADPGDPARGSGYIVLAMGKHGAFELNYSSDIDLIVLYDPAVAPVADRDEIGAFFVKITQRLVKLMQERTGEGYVFRTDLRLRPDPGSTAVAISTEAALLYYESSGQNWERAALIKARPIAGDIAAGEAFLAELVPFVFRKYLDYAAIADIHSIKRQIHEHRGHEAVAVAGHNIKLGRGGIREIEFFVQTQQLIAGGRDPALRGRETLAMLAALAERGWIEPAAEAELAACYRHLRKVEHRLQMIADEQTHTLPEDEAALAVVARLSGEVSFAAFAARLTATLETVRGHYMKLFESAPTLSTMRGSLVFTGDDEDPETVATLGAMGYHNPTEVSKTVRGWHFGRYPAMRSATARERLTEITPALLEALATTDNADAAFNAFDRFLARLPAGVQLFSLLASNPSLLRLLATVLGTAPRLAETMMRRPHVVDAVLDPAFFGRLPDKATLAARLATTLGEAAALEEALDRARIFGSEQAFLIGVRVISGTVGARAAGFAYADLADVLVAALLDAARRELERVHGRMKDGRIALLAMGKLGGREMTAASDLDLILLYDFDADAPASDGDRPLMGSQYYTRLTQRLIAALSAPTAEGKLYEVDFRLRPSGNAGPLATHIDAFSGYQRKDAWTWEHMALTRARPIAGDADLVERVEREKAAVLATPRDRAKVKADILEMRALLEQEKPAEGHWDLKQSKGGLVDIEFIAQFLQLTDGAARPEILDVETEAVLVKAAFAEILPAGDAEVLLPALRLYQRLVQILRLCVGGPFRPEEAPRGLLELLARAGELPDFAALDAALKETEAAVRASFERIIGKVPRKPRS
ncbi:bifunctional [glutamine synthetase] adenylyltransferase/[glutamine synthetase]-adenylyl-L-tyrosine phosphorylase [Prosthecomicrobium pneumaticum]|uniref:Bifunctional glutamine synthetase adenylyltransferase/adenylyl-removing enzyme n=1 Tax=Prosthecomicrobium pneumaticum TaxID=81895 RepID=A0A7W9FP99_9HYPH|nr:bifunctional [glutamine synthetase] adenylyltransferase/[glutamine synthetase]-adenylyl-L-tyrosine phosphorylase [Prosthecomicrobium pneumaticum]MBB5754277.1 glutamate-ammonia-ligase adenylyltransferase [Prosthecomicrobium pneumaticum]